MKPERLLVLFLGLAMLNVIVFGIFCHDWKTALMLVCANGTTLACVQVLGASNNH